MIKINNNNNQIIEDNNTNTKKVNTIFNSGLTSTRDNRFCIHCHIKLVSFNNERYVYKCPQCGVVTNIHNTEPSERLVTTFPTADPSRSDTTSGKKIMQNPKERMTRSQYFIAKNLSKKNESEDNDPYLKDFLRKNNKITITSLEYYDPYEQ